MKRILILAALLASVSIAMASGRATCPGANEEYVGKDVGIIATKSNDMQGSVSATGATRCTIKFHDNHKTAPYCMISGPEVQHIVAKVLRTSPTEVTFSFNPSLNEDGFDYTCVFKN